MAKPNLLNSVQLRRPNSNVFDLSHDVKTTMTMGKLVPVCTMECVPGDKFTIGCETLIRMAPMLAPVMQRMDVYVHYFFVPNRILWEDWEKWIVGDPTAGAFPRIPFSTANGFYTKLADYLGVPTPRPDDNITEYVSAFPFAAYQKIYDEYYRDQNLIASQWAMLTSGDGNVAPALRTLRTRAWEHDYFTAALPFAQKGDAVQLPIGQLADNAPVVVEQFVPGTDIALDGTINPGGTPGNAWATIDSGVGPDPGFLYAKTLGLDVDPTTINDLRRAFRLQEWKERNALGGTRYTENIYAHFGVRSSDKRLQRPEYITGVKSPLIVSEVLQTGETGATPQGTMAGHGVSVVEGNYGNYFCEEHGYIIGIMSVLPKTSYQQGIPKHFLKFDQFDYFWPEFANIGEQEIMTREVMAFLNGSDDVFGYTPRYAEYKFMNSRVCGDFKTTLDFWHLGRIFGGAVVPGLNQAFVECNPGERIFAVQNGSDYLWCHVLNKVRAVRKMPVYGTPMF